MIKFHKLLLRWCKCKAEAGSSDTHGQFASWYSHTRRMLNMLRLVESCFRRCKHKEDHVTTSLFLQGGLQSV